MPAPLPASLAIPRELAEEFASETARHSLSGGQILAHVIRRWLRIHRPGNAVPVGYRKFRHVRLPENIAARLDTEALRRRMTVSEVVATLVADLDL